MISLSEAKVHIALGVTDMRKSINGLSAIVQENFNLDPFSGQLFVFCNRQRNIIKILYWQYNGFCLWQKRLEKHKFTWPKSQKEVLEINNRELNWLLDGLSIHQKQAHEQLTYTSVI
jgi:transposase